MSNVDQASDPGRPVIVASEDQRQTPTVPCVQCRRTMRVKLLTPLLNAGDRDEVTYGCDACGAEVRRVVARG